MAFRKRPQRFTEVIMRRAICAVFVLVFTCGAFAADPVGPGSRVVFIGNTLFDRAQDFGYFEALLQERYAGNPLIVRTLAWSADEVSLRPRPENVPSLEDYLTTEKPDVIFAAFGFNESFNGPAGVEGFKRDLAKFIDDLLTHKYNGKTPPRIVLVSPIGFENLGAPMPDGHESIANQKLYAQAMAEVAKDKGIDFVDVLAPMLAAMQSDKKAGPLTINGVHLNDAGYQLFARQLYASCFHEDPPTFNESLRQAILDKNEKFFHRYRTLNDTYIYGERKNPYGVVNFPGEFTKWDQMIANRDARIAALAKGETVPDKIDDSNTLVLPAITGDRPINEWKSPADELKSFRIDPRFQVNCFASEEDFPELACPIQMRWDARGRLWVSCSTSYPQAVPGQEQDDKIIILEDTDGDGKADKCTTWADKLHIPLSFEFGNGGVYVSDQPHMMFLKDTDGDGKADTRERILTGFGTSDSHHALHDFAWSPDGDLIFRESIFLYSQIETPYGPVRVHDSSFFRFRPATQQLVPFGEYRSTNPWGITFDKWGFHVGSHPVFAEAVHVRNPPYPQLHVPVGNYIPAYSGTCGQEFIYSRQWPEELQGSYVRVRYKPTQTIELQAWNEMDSHYEEKKIGELIASSDLAFIPVDVRFGPRGDLYICDWYNPVKGHAQYSLRDTRRDKKSGRIWRVVAKDRPLVDAPKIAGEPIEKLLDLLKTYEYRTRYTVRAELRERDPALVKAALDKWVAQLDGSDPEVDHHRMEAIWMYRGIRAVNGPLLVQLLNCKDHHARAAATAQLAFWHDQVDPDAKLLARCADDENGLVRLEAAMAASWYGSKDAIAAALKMLDHPMDNYTTLALRETLDALKPIWQPDPAFQAANHHLIHFMLASGPKKANTINTTLPAATVRANEKFDKLNPQVVTIRTVPEKLLYDTTEFHIKAGKPVKIVLVNPDATAHNLVICAPGSEMKVGMAGNEMAKNDEGMKKSFIPEMKEVLWSMPLVNPGETFELRIHAPKEPGSYPYICTFPGHWLVMKGVMIVEK
ncbi:MAG: hypothetical protein GC162_02405 [Planctomycetes bacterium]|nr:hypothetical protein [Planctomycetota bacterium]